MENYEDRAIEAVNNYLMNLLQEKKFCEAKRVGAALEILVESKSRPGVERGRGENTCEAERPTRR